MGSENNSISKPRYDISMSKRTRKPLNFESLQESSAEEVNGSSVEAVNEEEKKKHIMTATVCEEDDDESKKCLKKLIEQGRNNSLGQHFTKEENQLQLVMKRPEGDDDGIKLKKMLSRYAKVVSHMIKLKRSTHAGYRKKQVLTLTK